MLLRKLEIFVIYAIFIIISTSFLVQNIDLKKDIEQLTFFVNDTHVLGRLGEAIQSDYDTNTIFLTRILHNKPLIYLENFFISIFRSTDLSFLFSLSKSSSMYGDSFQMEVFHSMELIFSLFALIYFLKNRIFLKKYFYILPALFLSLLTIGIFLPTVYLIKLIPLVIVLRTIYFIGILEFLKGKQWLKTS